MMLELSPFTLTHVAISLIGIASGFGVAAGFVTGRRLPVLDAVFLAFTAATSVTGFFFPIERFTPALAVGGASLAVLALACYSRYVRGPGGAWRRVYTGTALLAQYLNVFVLVAQLFQKVPVLHAGSSAQTELSFNVAQGAVLLGFLAVTFVALTRPSGASSNPAEELRVVPGTRTEHEIHEDRGSVHDA